MNLNTVLIIAVILGILFVVWEIKRHRRFVRDSYNAVHEELAVEHHATQDELLATKRHLSKKLDKISNDFRVRVERGEDNE